MPATSYSSVYGTGDRRRLINVTYTPTNLFTSSYNDANKLVDGAMAMDLYFAANTANDTQAITFDFKKSALINEAIWYQNNTSTHGVWKWQGSNDNTTYVDIGATFTLGGANKQVITTLNVNVNFYRYYRLKMVSGTTSVSPYLYEVEFKVFDPSYKKLITTSNGNTISVSNKRTYSNAVATDSMTSNTTPSGEVKQSSGVAGNMGWNAFDQTSTAWRPVATTNEWVSYDFKRQIKIGKYGIKFGAQAVSNSIKSWELQGSNDGEKWVVLDIQSGVTSWANNEIKTFEIVKPDLYSIYRLFVKEANNTVFYLEEIQLYELLSIEGVRFINTNMTEQTFLSFGMNKSDVVDLKLERTRKDFISNAALTLNSGKVFKQQVNSSKIKIKKVTIE